MVRLLAAAVALLAVVVMIAAMAVVSSRARPGKEVPGGSVLARTLNRLLSSSEPDAESWVVTRANSAHHAMVVEVEAPRLEDARAIAAEIVAPMRLRGYQEILVYVRRPGRDPDTAMRRIQWTPKGGFVETVYDARR